MIMFRIPKLAGAQLLALSALILLVSCSGTLLPQPAPAPVRHTLGILAAGVQGTQPGPGSLVLVVAQPRAAPGYDSRRMLYVRQHQTLEAFAFHEWVEPPAQLLAPLMLQPLQAGGFRAVLLAPSAAAGGWLLETELLALHQDFGTQPSQVRLRLRAVLLNAGTRQVMAWREFEASVPAARDDPAAGVQAAQAAVQQVLRELALFCEVERMRVGLEARHPG
jgi:cholesterol transport system auxiliary component